MTLFSVALVSLLMCCLVSGQVVSSDGTITPVDSSAAGQLGSSDPGAAAGDPGAGASPVPAPGGPIAGSPYAPGTQLPILAPANLVDPLGDGDIREPIAAPAKPASRPQRPLKRKPQRVQRRPNRRVPNRNANRRGQNNRRGNAARPAVATARRPNRG